MTSEEGSFARKTITKRLPIITDQLIKSSNYPHEIQQELLALKRELTHGQVQPLQEETYDRALWLNDLKPWLGKRWSELPWFLAETYFYRRILEITHYFQPGPYQGKDPFSNLKTQDMLQGRTVFESLYPSLTNLESQAGFHEFCIKALWGNRGDLSLMKTLEPSMDTQNHRIVLDGTNDAYRYLAKNQPGRIVYIFDNVGKELFFDLALIDFLLSSGLAGQVTCFVKNQPFFVSDAMAKDLIATLNSMAESNISEVRYLADRLNNCINAKTLQIEAPPFLTFGRMFRQMPSALSEQVRAHDLAILKGDVNYRRVMGDRHWPPTTPIEVAGGYFPTSFLSLRTLKAELIVGMTDEKLDQIKQEGDPDWMINGKRGLITFFENVI